MPETMKAVDIKGGAGPISAMFINAETPKPVPGPQQALVRIRAFGLNRMDLIQRAGHYPLPPQAGPIMGVEFSGTIESFGGGGGDGDADGDPAHRHGFQEGDEVFGLAYGGAYAEFIAVSTKMLLHKPQELSWEVAAGIPETWITATQAIHFVGDFDSLAGRTVLWHAGASGVSIAGIQLSRRAGAARVLATAGGPDKCAFVERELGADRAFDYRAAAGADGDGDWDRGVLDATGGAGADLVVDFVAGPHAQRNLACAARGARIVQLGAMGGAVLRELDVGQLLYKRIRWEGSTLRARDEAYQGRLRDRLEGYLPDFVSGALRVFVDRVFRMDEIQEAHALMEKNVTRGKIICTVP